MAARDPKAFDIMTGGNQNQDFLPVHSVKQYGSPQKLMLSSQASSARMSLAHETVLGHCTVISPDVSEALTGALEQYPTLSVNSLRVKGLGFRL